MAMHRMTAVATEDNPSLIVAPAFVERLRAAGVERFDDLWTLPRGWVDEPNRLGRGWSGVSRHELNAPDGSRIALYLKRQENYYLKWFHRLLGITSLKREHGNLRRCETLGIPTAAAITFASRRVGGNQQAMLVVAALDDFISLDRVLPQRGEPEPAGVRATFRIAGAVAQAVARFHTRRLSYSSLYPKHVMIHRRWIDGETLPATETPVRFIDIERLKRRLSLGACLRADLEKLNRHVKTLRRSPRLRFWIEYLRALGIDDPQRSLLRGLLAAHQNK